MAISSVEIIGRRVTPTSIQRKYHFHGPAIESEVIAHYPTLPQSVAGMPLSQAEAEEVRDIHGDWVATLTYGALPPGRPLQPQPIGTAEYEFNFVMPSAQIKRSLANVSRTPRAGEAAPDFKGLIGIVEGPDGLQVEGIDISPPAETFSLSYSAQAGVVTAGYQALVLSMVGTVNSATFAGIAAGQLLLTRVTGGVTSRISRVSSQNSWNIKFGFAYSPNAFNLLVGTITVPVKLGWHLLWTFDTPVPDVAARMTIPQPHTAYVEQIYGTADFRQLGIPGYTT